jgi:hypothetical protein
VDALQFEVLSKVSASSVRPLARLTTTARVLDPILFDLLDPSVRRSQSVTKINDRELQDFAYDAPMDQRLINYLLDTLLSVVRFGGQGFVKVANSTPIRRSLHPGLVNRVESCRWDIINLQPCINKQTSSAGTWGWHLSRRSARYSDTVRSIQLPYPSADMSRFLQSEPNDPRLAGMRRFNANTQSLSTDLLQTIIARGEIDQAALETVEAVIVTKLYTCVHTGRLDLQTKLLHLLHSVISALSTLGSQLPMTHQPRLDLLSDASQAPDVDREAAPQSYNMNPLLIQTLTDGIGALTNRPLLQHWLDFVLMTIPQFHSALQPAVEPLIECICRQLRSATNEIASARSQLTDTEDISSATSDAELIMLLHAIERLLLLNLSRQIEAADAEDDNGYTEKSATDGAGLFGYVSNVFGSEHPTYVPEEQLAVSRYKDDTAKRLIGRCNRPAPQRIVHSTGACLCCTICGSHLSGGAHSLGHPKTNPCRISTTERGQDAGAYLNICSGSAPRKFWNLLSIVGSHRYAFIVRALRPWPIE